MITDIERQYITEELAIILDFINKGKIDRAVSNTIRLIKNLESYGEPASREAD